MAIFSTPSGPFDYTFDATFPRIPKIEIATGGSFDYTFDNTFQIRATVKGSIGGSTFQKGGRSYTIRHHNVPTLKETIRKLTRMQIFKANISAYQGTNGTQRDTWESQKTLYPRIRSDGTERIPNRYHLFISSNQRADYSNVPEILSIGSYYPSPGYEMTAATMNFGTSELLLTFNQAVVPAGANLQFFISRPLPADSIALARSNPRLFLIIDEGDPTSGNYFSDFALQWPDPYQTVGFEFYILALLVPLATGQPQVAGEIFGTVI